MPHASVNGQRIYYEDTGGDGPAVVLAHGFLMDSEMFAPQVEALRGDYRVIAWDERGFGRTEFDGKPFTYWDSADDCLALMTHLGIERAVVGGMSQGGFLSMRAALRAPGRIRALILLNTSSALYTDEQRAANQGMVDMWLTAGPIDPLAEAVATIIIDDPAENGRWIAKWQARPGEALREPAACLMARDDITPRLGEITCPVLFIHGTRDTAIPIADAEMTASHLVGCSGVVAVDAAHAANLTNPAPVNAAIRSFLAGLPS